ncbi:MAG: hypothetical protein KDD82_19780 [Planctomycetes bacterium]|nr:hypothetical protein [Planctomycetota bacterium]
MFDKVWKVVLMVGILAAVVGGIVYLSSGEDRREMTDLMKDVAELTEVEFREALPRVRDVNALFLIVSGRSDRDEEVQFEERLAEAVKKSSKYKVIDWSAVREFEDSTWLGTIYAKLNIIDTSRPPSTFEKAVTVVETLYEKANFETDGLLWVDVTQFDEGKDGDGLGSRVGVAAKIYSLKRKEVVAEVPEISHGIESPWDLRYIRYRIGQSSILLRFLAWFVVSITLPWALIQVVRAVVKKKNNQLNIALLGALTLTSMLVAWTLLAALGTGFGAWLTVLTVGGLMGYYNYDACDYIERRLL